MKRILLLLTIALIAVAVMGGTAPTGWPQEQLPTQAVNAFNGVCTAQAHGENAPEPAPTPEKGDEDPACPPS